MVEEEVDMIVGVREEFQMNTFPEVINLEIICLI